MNEDIFDPDPHVESTPGLLIVHSQFYQSQIHLGMFGFECQSNSSTARLAVINRIRSGISCVSICNQEPMSRYFDCDTSTKICRIFKDASIVASSSATSRVGSVHYTADLYTSHAQPCAPNNCEINRYLVCNVYSRCQCPTGMVWNAQLCVGEEKTTRSISPFLSIDTRQAVNAVFFVVVNNNFSYRWNTTGITVAANQLNMPISVAVNAVKTLYIRDFANNLVWQWLWTTSNATILAGNSNGAFGSGLSALNGPFGITLDSSGGVYVADARNNRVVLWRNGSSVGTMIAGTGKETPDNCVAQHMFKRGSARPPPS
jgi:NHL repeat